MLILFLLNVEEGEVKKIFQKLKFRKSRACKYSSGSSKTRFARTMLSLASSY